MGYQTKADIIAKWEANASAESRAEVREAKEIRRDMAAAREIIAEGLAKYKKKKLKARSKKAAEEDPFADLANYESRDQIQDDYGWGFITEVRMDKLLLLWDLREESRHNSAEGGYHDRVTDLLETAMRAVGEQYAEKLMAYDDKRHLMEVEAERVAKENNARTWEREHSK